MDSYKNALFMLHVFRNWILISNSTLLALNSNRNINTRNYTFQTINARVEKLETTPQCTPNSCSVPIGDSLLNLDVKFKECYYNVSNTFKPLKLRGLPWQSPWTRKHSVIPNAINEYEDSCGFTTLKSQWRLARPN